MLPLLSSLLSVLPLKVVYGMSYLLGFIAYKILRIRRSLILKNLDIAFPDKYTKIEKDEIGFNSVVSFIFTELELLASKNGKLSESVTFANSHVLTDILKRGQGAYVLCIHIASWEACAAAVNRKIGRAHLIVKKVGGVKTDAFVRKIREDNGFLSIKREKKGDAYRAIGDIIGRGEIVGFVMDQARPGEPELPFFGRPAKTNTSFSGIWKKIPAPIVPCWSRRTEIGKYEVFFGEEIHPVVTGNDKEDNITQSLQFNRVVEDMIRQCPSQYFWLHNRWKL
ncbi:MAG: lysophospholipid acyltransferase family protein [Pseudomonadota bacterium]